jgi:hypothetical protein
LSDFIHADLPYIGLLVLAIIEPHSRLILSEIHYNCLAIT